MRSHCRRINCWPGPGPGPGPGPAEFPAAGAGPAAGGVYYLVSAPPAGSGSGSRQYARPEKTNIGVSSY